MHSTEMTVVAIILILLFCCLLVIGVAIESARQWVRNIVLKELEQAIRKELEQAIRARGGE